MTSTSPTSVMDERSAPPPGKTISKATWSLWTPLPSARSKGGSVPSARFSFGEGLKNKLSCTAEKMERCVPACCYAGGCYRQPVTVGNVAFPSNSSPREEFGQHKEEEPIWMPSESYSRGEGPLETSWQTARTFKPLGACVLCKLIVT